MATTMHTGKVEATTNALTTGKQRTNRRHKKWANQTLTTLAHTQERNLAADAAMLQSN